MLFDPSRGLQIASLMLFYHWTDWDLSSYTIPLPKHQLSACAFTKPALNSPASRTTIKFLEHPCRVGHVESDEWSFSGICPSHPMERATRTEASGSLWCPANGDDVDQALPTHDIARVYIRNGGSLIRWYRNDAKQASCRMTGYSGLL